MSTADPPTEARWRRTWRPQRGMWRCSLGTRIVGFLVLVTVLLALASTSAQMVYLYQQEKRALILSHERIGAALSQPLQAALNTEDLVQVDRILHSILSVQSVEFARLSLAGRPIRSYGAAPGSPSTHFTYTLGSEPDAILQIGISFDQLARRVWHQSVATLLSELAKILFVGMSMLWVFERIASRRLRNLADQVMHTSWRDPGKTLRLERKRSVLPDEIDRIIEALEIMWADARHAFAKLEDEKRRADRLNLSLRDSTEEQAALSAALSHDLISPVYTLDILLGELKGLSGAPVQSGVRDELISDLKQTADRIRHQIESVELYERLLSTPVRSEAVELETVLACVKQELGAKFDLAADQITWTALGHVTGNPDELAMLFRALVTNALIYASPDRRAEVRIAADPDQRGPNLLVEVTDNGIGIAEDHQKGVFGLFYRLHTYSDIPGTGMGLALCRRLMERIGGTISLRSTHGLTTTISLSFPKGGTQ